MSSLAVISQRVFQGVVPATIATVDAAGMPNVTYLSQVFRVDERHVALSCQFFNKTKKNVLENPHACVQILDPLTMEAYQLHLRFVRSETSGPIFDSMKIRIEAIASHTGMRGVFALLSADVYEVTRCQKLAGFLMPGEDDDDELPPPSAHVGRTEVRALQAISRRVTRARDLDELLTGVLEAVEEAFGFTHAMVLMPDETGERLVTVASRGYGDAGVGAEVAMGEGLIGTIARDRRVLRVANVDHELRYGRAIRTSVAKSSGPRALRPEIPLPGLPDAQSQMAIPLVSGDRLLGVLALESRDSLAFDEWDEAFLEIVANQVAAGIENVTRRDDAGDELAPPAIASSRPPQTAPITSSAPRCTRVFKLFRSDDCVFVDDEYLVRNVPGRILWKILRAHVDGGRTDFSNRELRLDASLGLPALRDNLESRLVLLRKRLEQRCPDLRIVSTSRGHFRLETTCAMTLEEAD